MADWIKEDNSGEFQVWETKDRLTAHGKVIGNWHAKWECNFQAGLMLSVIKRKKDLKYLGPVGLCRVKCI